MRVPPSVHKPFFFPTLSDYRPGGSPREPVGADREPRGIPDFQVPTRAGPARLVLVRAELWRNLPFAIAPDQKRRRQLWRLRRIRLHRRATQAWIKLLRKKSLAPARTDDDIYCSKGRFDDREGNASLQYLIFLRVHTCRLRPRHMHYPIQTERLDRWRRSQPLLEKRLHSAISERGQNPNTCSWLAADPGTLALRVGLSHPEP